MNHKGSELYWQSGIEKKIMTVYPPYLPLGLIISSKCLRFKAKPTKNST